MDALRTQGGPLELGGGPSGHPPPLIVNIAEACRWDAVRTLLQQPDDVAVCVASLLVSPALAKAPSDVVHMLEARAEWEVDGRARPRTLKEYFRHLLSGEVMGSDSLPSCLHLKDGILRSSHGVRVLNRGLWLDTAG